MKTRLALSGLLLTCGAALHAAQPAADTPGCPQGFEEAKVERIYAGVVSYVTTSGKKGAAPQGAVGASKPGELFCLPGEAQARPHKAATSTK